MASEILSFKKEFEDVIIKQNFKEALNSLISNSKEYIYLEFCEEYKKCISSKAISKELISILEKASSISYDLAKVLETRRNLLEYDLPSTTQKRKNEIIDILYENYGIKGLDYSAPYFVKEKLDKSNDMEIENEDDNNDEAILELTDDIIKNEVEKNIKYDLEDSFLYLHFNENMSYNKIIEIILNFMENNSEKAAKIINKNKIPFFLMKKNEFSKVISFLKDCKYNINYFGNMTSEQIERILKEVNNPIYISKDKIISTFINKKYNKLLRDVGGNLIELKNVLMDIYNILIKYSSKYCVEALIYILKINKMKDIFDINPLIEYLKCKKELLKEKEEDDYSYDKYILDVSIIDIKKIKMEKFIEELILYFFIHEKAKIENLVDYIDNYTLERLYYISRLLRGEESLSPIDDKYITYNQYSTIAQKKEITICEHNPTKFKINEEIKIDLNIKNIRNMNISIYEINTENYFLDKKSEIDSSIDIEGLIASQSYDIKIEGTENPLKNIRKTIELNQIPKDRPGVYLIELLGDGISSRIIIKKGKLNLISRNTTRGIMCQIINEKNEILKDAKTFLWYNDTKFSCEPNEGLVILPYKILSKNENTCVLVHDSYADIARISIPEENFKLKGYFQFLNEALIWGESTKVCFSPFLFVNARKSPIENIKNGKITVNMIIDNIDERLPIKKTFENLVFNDDNKEYEFEIYIPPMIASLTFNFDCEVTNSKGERIDLFYEQDSEFKMTGYDINKKLFRKCGKKYYYENIGRNGEIITSNSGKHKRIELYTNYYNKPIYLTMKYDKEGKLNLGELQSVTKIKFKAEKWYNLNNYSKYCYPERIDIIEGESFILPLYSNKNEVNLDNNYFILYEYFNKNENPTHLMDIKNEIILNKLDINGDNKHYYEFKLGHNLKKGTYRLIFGEGIEDNLTKINIIVNEGTHWMNLKNYIINSNGYIENSEIKTPIYLQKLNIDKSNNIIKFECAKTQRNIKYTHANIYFFQYQTPEVNLFFDEYYKMLNKDTENLIINEFFKWKNIYLSNKTLNEEMEYVLHRKNYGEHIGNTLPFPSLLLKKSYIKDCYNEEEKIEEGEDYHKKEDIMRWRHRRKDFGLGAARRCLYREEKYFNNDFFNFLKYSGYSINNIEPINIDTNEQNAKFEIKVEKNIFNKYTYMQIVLIDDKSISSNLTCLCENNDKYEVETKNIANHKALDTSKNYTEINKIELIKSGNKFNINESSNYIIIDSINKLSKFYLLKLDEDQDWKKYKFIFSLDKFNEKEFIRNYNEVCAHEINIFLYFKFPELFNKYVKNNLKYKFEKTFIDYFLLDDYDTLIQYLTALKIKSLSTFELCLLLLKLIHKNPNEAEKIKNIIKSRISNENLESHYITNFNTIISMSLNESKKENNSKENAEECKEGECEEENDEEGEYDLEKEESDKEKVISNNRTTRTIKCMPNVNPCISYGRRHRTAFEEVKDEDEDVNMESDNLNSFLELDMVERKDNYKNAVNKAEKDIGGEFEKPGKVKEYQEMHYYLEKFVSYEIKNPLWLDFAEYIIKEKTHKNFLSKNILYNKDVKINEIIYILSVIDLPINSLKHEYKRNNNSKTTSINPISNIILFIKEISEQNLDLNNKLIISQRINQGYYYEENINTNNCSINLPYDFQAILTNISNKSLNFQLFIQIPQGAIGLDNTYYTNLFKIELKPYETKDYKISFYFPKEGTFVQYYPVASQNNKIISAGNSLVYKVKKEYIPSKKIEIIENNKYSKDMRIEGKLRNILVDESLNSENKLEKILNYFKNDIFNDDDLENILYIIKSYKKFFLDLIDILRKRGYYDENVWSFSFHHKDEKSIKEYLSINPKIIKDLGYDFKSKLYSYSEINDAIINPHLEYNPISNARKHPFGKNDNNETMIANVELKQTYEQFIINLISLRELRIKEKLQLCYYLIIQDRMNEALDIFNRIKKEEIEENIYNKSYKIQYDYLYAYLDFTFGYPQFKIAKSVCNYYKDFPLLHWKQKFEEIEEELLEYENKGNIDNISMDIIEEDKDQKSIIKELKEKEPKLSFNIENKDGKIVLLHCNINEITIKLYFIDLEILFTREPKISEIINKSLNNEDNMNKDDYMKEKFGFVQANYIENIKLPDTKNNKDMISTIYEIPKMYQKKNLLIEVNYESIKLLDLYLSSNLNIIITESLGEFKVLDQNLKPLIKAYVKVYAKLNNNIQFYKDGYTDLNGNFNYLALNTDLLKHAKKFYIYVSEVNHGDTIKECFPPKNIGNISNEDILDEIKREKRNKRNLWRMLNNKRKGPSFEDIFNDKN